MFSNMGNGKELTHRLKSDFGVKAHGLLPGIAPQKGALVLFDDRKSGSEEGRRKTLPLVLWQSGHTAQAVLVSLGELFIPFKIKRGDTHEFFINEGPKVERHFVVVTLEMAILYRPIGAEHLMPKVVGIDGLNS